MSLNAPAGIGGFGNVAVGGNLEQGVEIPAGQVGTVQSGPFQGAAITQDPNTGQYLIGAQPNQPGSIWVNGVQPSGPMTQQQLQSALADLKIGPGADFQVTPYQLASQDPALQAQIAAQEATPALMPGATQVALPPVDVGAAAGTGAGTGLGDVAGALAPAGGAAAPGFLQNLFQSLNNLNPIGTAQAALPAVNTTIGTGSSALAAQPGQIPAGSGMGATGMPPAAGTLTGPDIPATDPITPSTGPGSLGGGPAGTGPAPAPSANPLDQPPVPGATPPVPPPQSAPPSAPAAPSSPVAGPGTGAPGAQPVNTSAVGSPTGTPTTGGGTSATGPIAPTTAPEGYGPPAPAAGATDADFGGGGGWFQNIGQWLKDNSGWLTAAGLALPIGEMLLGGNKVPSSASSAQQAANTAGGNALANQSAPAAAFQTAAGLGVPTAANVLASTSGAAAPVISTQTGLMNQEAARPRWSPR
jgi:hypothetical protein